METASTVSRLLRLFSLDFPSALMASPLRESALESISTVGLAISPGSPLWFVDTLLQLAFWILDRNSRCDLRLRKYNGQLSQRSIAHSGGTLYIDQGNPSGGTILRDRP
jgi:hypothetical protein